MVPKTFDSMIDWIVQRSGKIRMPGKRRRRHKGEVFPDCQDKADNERRTGSNRHFGEFEPVKDIIHNRPSR